MIVRFVKLCFRPDEVETFLALFDRTRDRIRHFEGCTHLELLHDTADPRVFFTYSIWQNAEALDRYRESELFQSTWRQTKILFDQAPQAWSLTAYEPH